MTEVISVRFRGGCKNYDFDPRGLTVKMGDQVIVETAQGLEFATCTQGNHEVEDEAVVQPLCPVVRMATDADVRVVEYNRKKESDAFDICEQKIADHGLEMKLVNVSASFDGNKIIFFFTADGRVDFRELVRDLASVFRARIELRQIGVRDEAKMIGGLGICGRPFCCSEFLDGFMPVSIKMAKTQNLSLNPTKISGTCGRLMCCLKYEQNAYEDALKRMPKQESFVQTPDGPGNVKSVDLLRETVKVSLDSAPESLKTYRGCEVKILRNGKGGREGIEIPPRTERYVEPVEEIAEPVFATPFYLNSDLEDAPIREKMGVEGSAEGKPRRRHRGGHRRRGPEQAGASAHQSEEKKEKQEKNERSDKRPEKGGSRGERGDKRDKTDKRERPERNDKGNRGEKAAGHAEKSANRPEKTGNRSEKTGNRSERTDKGNRGGKSRSGGGHNAGSAAGGEKTSAPQQAKAPQQEKSPNAPQGEGGAKRRRPPHYRNHHRKSGGEGGGKAE